jgi:hypothetical protein
MIVKNCDGQGQKPNVAPFNLIDAGKLFRLHHRCYYDPGGAVSTKVDQYLPDCKQTAIFIIVTVRTSNLTDTEVACSGLLGCDVAVKFYR